MTEPSPRLPLEIEDAVWDLLARPAAERAPALEALCALHPGLADAIRRFTAMAGSAPGGRSGESADDLPVQIGAFHVLREIGRGGMGRVLLAERREPVRQQVAIKLIKRGMDTDAAVQRFQRERRLLARMQHDGIAKVFDCGATETGQLYFVMEHVPGTPLTRYCDERRLTIAARLALFQQVCAAVQHAHGKFVVHRDLKPSNILVAEIDGQPVPKVIDFGLAVAFGQDHDVRVSNQGFAVGTPLYMAPEQAAGNVDVDVRVDVYSLGVVLFELLSGCLPVGEQEVSRWLRGDLEGSDTPRPSSRLGSDPALLLRAAADRCVSGSALRRVLSQDLDWVVLRAVAKDPERRYPQPSALAEDLQRYLDGVPVQAGPPSRWNVVRKFVRRHRGRLVGAAIVLVTGFGGTAWAASERAGRQASETYSVGEFARRMASEGDWETAARSAEGAVAAGQGPRCDRLLEATEYWLAANQRKQARTVLAGVADSPDAAGSHRRRLLALELDPPAAASAMATAAQLLADARASASTDLSKADLSFLAALAAKEPEEALRHVEAALDLDPRHVLAQRALLPLLLFTGRTDQVIRAAERQTILFKKDAAPRFAAVLATRLLGDHEGARARLAALPSEAERELASEVCELVGLLEKQLGDVVNVVAKVSGAKESISVEASMLRLGQLFATRDEDDRYFRFVPSLEVTWGRVLGDWSAGAQLDPVLACYRIATGPMDQDGLLQTEAVALGTVGKGLFGANPAAKRALVMALNKLQGHLYMQRWLQGDALEGLKDRMRFVARLGVVSCALSVPEYRAFLSSMAQLGELAMCSWLVSSMEAQLPAGDPWPDFLRAKILLFDRKNPDNVASARLLLTRLLARHPDFAEAKTLFESLPKSEPTTTPK